MASAPRVLWRGLILVALFLAGCAPALTGKPAPDFAVTEVSGRTLALGDFRGKNAAVLVFYHSYG